MASFSKHHLTKQISTWINVHGKSFFFQKELHLFDSDDICNAHA